MLVYASNTEECHRPLVIPHDLQFENDVVKRSCVQTRFKVNVSGKVQWKATLCGHVARFEHAITVATEAFNQLKHDQKSN